MKRKIVVGMLVNVLVGLILTGWVKAGIEQATLRVDGLACPFCAYGLEKKIRGLEAVNRYDVDLKEGKVYVGIKTDAQIETKSLYKAVKEAGFTLRSISLQVKGKIGDSEEGLILIAEESQKFLLFENETLLRKYHQGRPPQALGEDLKKRLRTLKGQEKQVLIEGVVHEHEGLPPALAVEKLEVLEKEENRR